MIADVRHGRLNEGANYDSEPTFVMEVDRMSNELNWPFNPPLRRTVT